MQDGRGHGHGTDSLSGITKAERGKVKQKAIESVTRKTERVHVSRPVAKRTAQFNAPDPVAPEDC